MADGSRIPTKLKDAVPYLDNLDDLQLSPGVPATTKKWENWDWS